ncbi:MAG: hypothetical protein Q8N53_04385, partial [Longimicrobiales bacterium]|nr:hypothetical protein [Longimicrobiales bacterium]
ATSTGKPWVDRKFDLRVEDHPTPVPELRRLVRLQRAYNTETVRGHVAPCVVATLPWHGSRGVHIFGNPHSSW